MSGLQEGQQNSQGCEGDDKVLRGQVAKGSLLRSNLVLIVVAGEPLHGFMQGSDQSTSDYLRGP